MKTIKEQIEEMIKDVITNSVNSHITGVEDRF